MNTRQLVKIYTEKHPQKDGESYFWYKWSSRFMTIYYTMYYVFIMLKLNTLSHVGCDQLTKEIINIWKVDHEMWNNTNLTLCIHVYATRQQLYMKWHMMASHSCHLIITIYLEHKSWMCFWRLKIYFQTKYVNITYKENIFVLGFLINNINNTIKEINIHKFIILISHYRHSEDNLHINIINNHHTTYLMEYRGIFEFKKIVFKSFALKYSQYI